MRAASVLVMILSIGFAVSSFCLMQKNQEDFTFTMSRLQEENIDLANQNEHIAKMFAVVLEENAMYKTADLPEPSAVIGIRNNNPMNVKGTGWLGQVGQDKFGHAVFPHHSYGLRAGARVLKTYYYKHGLKTIDAIIDRYCIGNREEYKAFLSKRLGVGIKEELDLEDCYMELLKAIVYFECGEQPYPDHDFVLVDVWRNTMGE